MRTRLIPLVVAISLLLTVGALGQGGGARERARGPYKVGLENMKAEAWNEAVKSFKTALDIDPSFEMAFYMLGRAHMAQKKFADAAAAYERCRALYQQQSGRQYANAQERQRSRDTQLREIDDVIRNYQAGTQTASAMDAIRQLQNRRREIEEAMSRGNSTMTLDLTVPAYVSLALGSAYFRMGSLAGAEKEYKAAIAADPKAGEAHSNLAVVYFETGRYTDAERSVTAAEKTGFKVHPQLKQEIKEKLGKGT